MNVRGIEDVSFAEAEFGDVREDSGDEGGDETTAEEVTGPGLQRILSPDQQGSLTDDEAFMVYLGPIISLARMRLPGRCPDTDCGQDILINHESVGSALYLKWVSD